MKRENYLIGLLFLMVFVWGLCKFPSAAPASYSPNPQRSNIYAPSGSGFSTTVPDGVTIFIIKPTALLAAGTVVLPPNPTDGMPLTLESIKTVTLLTVAPNTGQSLATGGTMLATAYTPARYKYSSIDQTWYPN